MKLLTRPPLNAKADEFPFKRWFEKVYISIQDLFDYVNSPEYYFNGDMEIWQSGTPANITASVTAGVGGADLFTGTYGPNWTQYTTARQATTNLPIFRYCMRRWRNFPQTDTSPQYLHHDLETNDAVQFQGRQITFSCYLRVGAEYSGTPITLGIYVGTGTDQNLLVTGYTNQVGYTTSAAATNSWHRYSVTALIPTDATQLGLAMFWNHTGTAAPTDYVETTGWQIDTGIDPAPFRHTNFQKRLAVCQRRYFKTFAPDQAPVSNVGTMSGCYRFLHMTAGATTIRGPTFNLPVQMRIVPNITTYNPAAAGADPYDDGAGVTGTFLSTQSSRHAVRFAMTANAASIVGHSSGVHFVADARL